MMIPLILSTLSYISFLNVDDKLNQLDLNGKTWKVYWDAQRKNTDSSHTVHTWHDYGSNLYPMSGRGKKCWMVDTNGTMKRAG